MEKQNIDQRFRITQLESEVALLQQRVDSLEKQNQQLFAQLERMQHQQQNELQESDLQSTMFKSSNEFLAPRTQVRDARGASPQYRPEEPAPQFQRFQANTDTEKHRQNLKRLISDLQHVQPLDDLFEATNDKYVF